MRNAVSTKGRKLVKLGAVMFAMMIEEMMAGPCTAQDIAAHTGMCLTTVQRTLRAMYDRKVVHIAGWECDGAGRRRVFGLGAGKDKPRPAAKSMAQIQRDYRARQAHPIQVARSAWGSSQQAQGSAA